MKMNKNKYLTGIVGLIGLVLVLSTSLGVGATDPNKNWNMLWWTYRCNGTYIRIPEVDTNEDTTVLLDWNASHIAYSVDDGVTWTEVTEENIYREATPEEITSDDMPQWERRHLNVTYYANGTWTGEIYWEDFIAYAAEYDGYITLHANGTWSHVKQLTEGELLERYYDLYWDTKDELDRVRGRLFWAMGAAVGLTAIIGILVITNRRKVTEKEVTSCEEAEE